MFLFVYQYFEASIEAFLLVLTPLPPPPPSLISTYCTVLVAYLIIEVPVLSEYFKALIIKADAHLPLGGSSYAPSTMLLLARLSFM